MTSLGCKRFVWPLLVLVLVSGCAPSPERPPMEPESEMPRGYPLADYERALSRGGHVYRVDPDQSEIVILVYRGGRLARLGHNHTVASRDVRGYVLRAEPTVGSRLDLFFPVRLLVVDDPADRATAGEGFDTEPSAKAIEGTRGNLLGDRVLDAGRYPFVEVGGRVLEGEEGVLALELRLRVRGTTTTQRVRPEMAISPQRIVARGELEIAQTAFGIEPYSVLGGALRVEDQMLLRYRLVAERVLSPSDPPSRTGHSDERSVVLPIEGLIAAKGRPSWP